jgi:hypothetical protein
MATLKLSTVQSLIEQTNLSPEEKDRFKATAGNLAQVPDTWVYRIVVLALGAAIFIPLLPVAMKDSATAQMLLPIATGALGALAGLLAPSPA